MLPAHHIAHAQPERQKQKSVSPVLSIDTAMTDRSLPPSVPPAVVAVPVARCARGVVAMAASRIGLEVAREAVVDIPRCGRKTGAAPEV